MSAAEVRHRLPSRLKIQGDTGLLSLVSCPPGIAGKGLTASLPLAL